MSYVRDLYQKASNITKVFDNGRGLMVGAKNPTPYFRLNRLNPNAEKATTTTEQYGTRWDAFKSNFLPKAEPVDDNILKYVSRVTVIRSVGGSDKNKPKNECKIELQFSIEEALRLRNALKNKEMFKPGDFDTKVTESGDWFMNFPYFSNAQKLDEKVFIVAGYSDLEPEDCVLDVVSLDVKQEPTDKDAKSNRVFSRKGDVVRKGVTFRPYEIIFGGAITRPNVVGSENGLVTVTYTLRNLLSANATVSKPTVQQGVKGTQDQKKNAETFAEEVEKVVGTNSPSNLLKKYEVGGGETKFYEKLEQLLKARLFCVDGPKSLERKIKSSSSSNYTKLLQFSLVYDTYLFLDIPKNYTPYNPDRVKAGKQEGDPDFEPIDVRNLNADKPPSFSYSRSFADFMHRMCSAWGLAYIEYTLDDGKSVIYITPMTEFLKPGSNLLSSFEVDKSVGDRYALLLRYGIEVVSFSYMQKPSVDVQDSKIGVTVWDTASNDWVTYKMDKKAIEYKYRNAPDKADLLKKMFEWARSSPDDFIIYFTRIAGEFKNTRYEPEKVHQGAGVTLQLKLKHPIPGLQPGMSIAFDVGIDNPDDVMNSTVTDGGSSDPTQILPVYITKPIYQISKITTKLEPNGHVYSQEIECEG